VGRSASVQFGRLARVTLAVAFACVAVFVFCVAGKTATRQSSASQNENSQKKKIESVFVRLKGDPKLVHRLFTFLDFGFEDNGFLGANSADGADAIVKGTLENQSTKANIGVGIVRLQMTSQGKQETATHCAAMSSDENGELFEGSAKATAERLRRKFPNLRTVIVDDASNVAESKSFAIELPDSLKASGFSVTKVGPADLVLRVDLAREKVAVVENSFKYDVQVMGKDGSLLFTQNGTGTLTARLAGNVLEACPSRFTDLDWLTGGDALAHLAREITKSLKSHSVGQAAAP